MGSHGSLRQNASVDLQNHHNILQVWSYVQLPRVKLVGAMLLNQFIVQTEDQNRGSPLPDKKRLMVSI